MTTRIRTGWRIGAALCTLLGAAVVSGVAMAQAGDDRRGPDGPALREDAPKPRRGEGDRPRRERAGVPEDLKNRLREYIREEVESGATFEEIRDSLLGAMPERFQAIARERMAERRDAVEGGRGKHAGQNADRGGNREGKRGMKEARRSRGSAGPDAGPHGGPGMREMNDRRGGRMGRDDAPRGDRGQRPGQPLGRGPGLGGERQGPPMEAGRGGQPPRERAGEGQRGDWRPMNPPQDRPGRGDRGPENGERQRRPGPGPDHNDRRPEGGPDGRPDRHPDQRPDRGRQGEAMGEPRGDRDNRPDRRGDA